ncbi:MAG TPA: hypothetical protein VFE05_04230 [Longimicrobiaceae bacterium]|jgi:hypothetical protein|nr:hypothetical protein [Longimicrobiaceae bacterium]
MTSLSESTLQEIEVRADAATPGIAIDAGEDGTWSLSVEMGGQRVPVADRMRYHEDAVFLRDGPADVQALLGRVRALDGMLRRATLFLRDYEDADAIEEPSVADNLRALIEEIQDAG